MFIQTGGYVSEPFHLHRGSDRGQKVMLSSGDSFPTTNNIILWRETNKRGNSHLEKLTPEKSITAAIAPRSGN